MRSKRFLIAALALLAVFAVATWLIPASNSYLFLPDEAAPLGDRVEVEGGKPHPPGGIYFVEVVVRKASLLEEHIGALRPDGADLVPKEALVPPGSSFDDRREQNRRLMSRSQEVAAAVALRELGYDVEANPDGAEVAAVGSDTPAAGKLVPTDVIVAVDGASVRTPADLRRLIAKHEPGDSVRLGVRSGEKTRTVDVGTNQPQSALSMPVDKTSERIGDLRLVEIEPDHPGPGVEQAFDPDRPQPAQRAGDQSNFGREVPDPGHRQGCSMSNWMASSLSSALRRRRPTTFGSS